MFWLWPGCRIMDPTARTIEVFALRGEGYELLGKYGSEEQAASEVLVGFAIGIAEVFPR